LTLRPSSKQAGSPEHRNSPDERLLVLDFLTTWVGFRMGLAEASPFVQFLMNMGPMDGVVLQSYCARTGAYCAWRSRFHVIQWINYWYAALVIRNLALIVTR